MSKFKTVFVCQNCGYVAPKWAGRCNNCDSWNSFIEEVELKEDKQKNQTKAIPGKAYPILEIEKNTFERQKMFFTEFDRVLGGGLVPGSLVLLGGEPGIGKSTLILQSVLNLTNRRVLYISGEESESQIKLRADRIGIKNTDCFIYTETNIQKILATIEELSPDLIIIDSIQTVASQDLSSSPGTISQIRECTRLLQEYAKSSSTPIILIGHINKDGDIAGPMSLEHIVDVVLQFEGDSNYFYRLLRPKKNRFGSTYEIGVFEMTNTGLKEINDPGNILLSDENLNLSGVTFGTTAEGTRTLMIEIQALVGNAVFSSPQRNATGFDSRRFQMLLAVIEKRLGLRLSQKDIFLNIAGGLKINDPAADLAVIAAVISSLYDKAPKENSCFIGEGGLSGQIKPVSFIEKRVSEASRLGFNRIYMPNSQKSEVKIKNIELITISDITDFARKFLK
ncbi:MAG TPA: DNA repair protein RadA [Bacteroidales bacterium]|nr:DNA repair protein RadA [Bacteroidales bacterium]HOR60430.1 DNA repair protein RadA [Bacteroidales bacterium]HPL04841.1 DNA repair protein RadA [Bacteroidales bacterium]